MIYVPATLISVLAIVVWLFQPYEPGSNFGYYLGLVGACMMLSLFLYPIRKYWGPAQRLGSLRAWFIAHVSFGTCGPVLVLFHSAFQTKSFNASVALWAMVIVVISGLIGRFIYVHMYQGLEGSQATLQNMEGHLEQQTKQAEQLLSLAPQVRESLDEYRRHVFATREFTWGKILSFISIGWNGQRLVSRSIREMDRAVQAEAKRQQWSRSKLLAEKQIVTELIEDYVRVIDTTARYAYWESMLAWWHLLHVPLVYLLLATGIAHVVAVHWY